MREKIKLYKKPIIMAVSVILVLGIVLIISFMVTNKFYYQKNKDSINEKTNNSEIKEDTSSNINYQEETKQKEDEQTEDQNNNLDISQSKEEITTNDNTSTNNTNKSNSKSKNTNTTKKETNTNTNEKKENSVKEKKEEIVKHTCTDADSGYVNWKNNYLQKYDTSRLYDSFDLAYAAGDKISYYSYGFIVDKAPSRYSDDTCTKENYILEIYVPSGICENNPMIYVPNNIDILGQQLKSVDYLKQIGYECAGKNL